MARSSRRYWRTIVIGTLSMAVLLWAAIDQFGVAPQDLWRLFIGALLGAAIVVFAAGAVFLVWLVLRRVLGRFTE